MLELLYSLLEWHTVLLALVCCVCMLLLWRSQQSGNLPPGPAGLPFVGSLLDVVKAARTGTFVNFIGDLHKKYGKIVSFPIGVQRFVAINDGAMMVEAFSQEEYAYRPVDSFPILKQLAHGSARGVFFGNGEGWVEMRKFALLSLRDFGVGKKTLDEMIETEASILCQQLENMSETNDGIVADLKMKIQHASANVIHHIAFGYRYDYNDPAFQNLVKKLYDFFDVNPLGFPENFIPILRYFPRLKSYLANYQDVKFLRVNKELEEYIVSQIDDHKTTYCEGEVRDFIDLYIKYEKEHKDHYTKENIFATILDLFRAGTDTTATTLSWSVMYLVQNQQMQQELRAEIDEVVGGRMFQRSDKDKLTKTRAFINEVHRYVSIAPQTTPHTVTTARQFKGYTIPANAIITGSLFSIHHDEEHWVEPYKFRIDRWIGENGELLKHEGHFYPFSAGKRACAGRQLANIEVIIMLVEMLQKFRFEQAEGYDDMTDQQGGGFLRSPQSFHFKVTKCL